ncbi:hypothetical protein CLU96_2321 [Chryseobacterium sp. 52]|uniref:hypothetical protein n=1 Tax=Chryseobacterium sp. 52 TaxID=2035213 RepID=UPI000C1A861E|nr:hypothetical protein [Chryseobacterium sp. 52]PIF45319.1 hypothetical protein CLU96_2321 [Chryseobacterium sp. 52]
MKIELKNIQFSEHLSEETNAFAASLYIEGIKAGTASNRGRGGATDYRSSDDRGKKLIAEAEAYCKSLPPEKFNSGGKDHLMEMNLEGYIDKLLLTHLGEKDKKQFQKKVERAMDKGVVVGIPGKEFTLWAFNLPMEKVLQHPKGPETIKSMLVKDILPKLIGENIIMNTNIPIKILQEAGLKESQYVKSISNENIVKEQKKNSNPRRKTL